MHNDKESPREIELHPDLERELQRQSLGPGPSHRGTLMYDCGYAAGFAAASKQSSFAKRKWQALSLVAAILVCVSFSSHFFSSKDQLEVQAVTQLGELAAQSPQKKPTSPIPQSDSWSTYLAREQRVDPNNVSSMRASGITRDNTIGESSDVIEFAPMCDENAPLRPSDFPLLLKG